MRRTHLAKLVAAGAAKPLDRADDPVRRDRSGELRWRAAEMLAQQAIAKEGDGAPRVVVLRLDGEIAFGVDAHRAVAEIGGADAQQPVVDDERLRMNADPALILADAVRARHDRVTAAQALVRIGRAQMPDDARLAIGERGLLEPAVAFARQHDDDLGPGLLGKPRRDRIGNAGRRQILRLDVDRMARPGDRVEPETLHLAHFRAAVMLGLGAGDRHRDLLEIGCERGRPPLCRAPHHRCRIADRAPPTLARELDERRDDPTLDRHLDVMEWRIGLAVGIETARIVRPVRRCIPTPHGEIDAADEGHIIIDDDDFLMMRGADRVIGGKAQPQAAMPRPLAIEQREGLAFDRIDHREVPDQDVDAQVPPAAQQRIEERAELAGSPSSGSPGRAACANECPSR